MWVQASAVNDSGDKTLDVTTSRKQVQFPQYSFLAYVSNKVMQAMLKNRVHA